MRVRACVTIELGDGYVWCDTCVSLGTMRRKVVSSPDVHVLTRNSGICAYQ